METERTEPKPELRLILIPAPNDPTLYSQEYQKELRDFAASLKALAAAGIADDKKGPLFRAAIGRTGKLSDRPLSRVDAWYMVRRRAKDAGVETAIGNHSFRAIGLTDYLENGGDINIAKRMAGHANIKTTELYDRRDDDVSFSEIERVGI
jgi:integrase